MDTASPEKEEETNDDNGGKKESAEFGVLGSFIVTGPR